MVSFPVLVSVCAVFVIPGAAAWVTMAVKLGRLDAHRDNHDQRLERIENKLDKLIEK